MPELCCYANLNRILGNKEHHLIVCTLCSLAKMAQAVASSQQPSIPKALSSARHYRCRIVSCGVSFSRPDARHMPLLAAFQLAGLLRDALIPAASRDFHATKQYEAPLAQLLRLLLRLRQLLSFDLAWAFSRLAAWLILDSNLGITEKKKETTIWGLVIRGLGAGVEPPCR